MRISIILAVSLFACRQPTALEYLANDIEALRDDMCRCRDRACTAAVDKQMTAWSKPKPDDAPAEKVDTTDYKAIKTRADLDRRIDFATKELVACKRRATGDDKVAANLIAKMTEIADQFCACKDRSCAQTIAAGFAKDDFGREFVANDEEKRKVAALEQRIEKCAKGLLAF